MAIAVRGSTHCGAIAPGPSSAWASAAKSSEKRTSRAGLIVEHRNRLGIKGFHPVLDGLDVGLEYRDGCPDLMGEVTKKLATGGLDRFEPFGHPIESPCQVGEIFTEAQRRDANVIAAVGYCSGGRGDLGD